MKRLIVAICATAAMTASVMDAEEKQPWEFEKYGIPKTDNPDAIPTLYAKPGKIAQIKQLKSTPLHNWGIKTVMLGDSITAGWRWSPKAKKAPKILSNLARSIKGNIYSYAISGDETKNVLWQITDGEVIDERIKPSVITLMIGVNNILRRKSDASIRNTADGIKTTLSVLEKKYPKSRILLFAVLPHFSSDHTARSVKLNKIIEKFADFKKVYYLDMSDKFLKDGKVSTTLFYDGLHPNDAGYQLWADTMKPYLDDLLENNGEGELWNPIRNKIAKSKNTSPENK